MRYIVQALVYSFYDYCFSSLALLVALQNAKKNDFVASLGLIGSKFLPLLGYALAVNGNVRN